MFDLKGKFRESKNNTNFTFIKIKTETPSPQYFRAILPQLGLLTQRGWLG